MGFSSSFVYSVVFWGFPLVLSILLSSGVFFYIRLFCCLLGFSLVLSVLLSSGFSSIFVCSVVFWGFPLVLSILLSSVFVVSPGVYQNRALYGNSAVLLSIHPHRVLRLKATD